MSEEDVNVGATTSRGEKRKRSMSNSEDEGEVELGPISEPELILTILEKEEKTTKATNAKYYYFLVKEDGRNKLVEVLSYHPDRAYIYDKLELGCTYEIFGAIKRVEENIEYLQMRKSEYTWKYVLLDVACIERLEERPRKNVNPGTAYYPGEAIQIPKLKEFIEEPRKYFQYRLVERVRLLSGNIYRYIGCRKCKKSRPRHVNERIYECASSKCGFQGSADEILETFMMICNLTIKDDEGNELKNIVCFNDATVKVLGKNSNQYLCDEDAEDDLQKILNSRISLRLSCQERDEPYGYSVVADYIAIPDPVRRRIEADARAFPESYADLEISDDVNIVIKDPNSYAELLPQEILYELNSAGPSGYLLLLNVFKYEAAGDREGANMDFLKLFGLFRELDFETYGNDYREPLLLPHISEKIAKFKQDLVRNNISSFTIIVMGHGCDYNLLTLSNEQNIRIDKEIMEPFSSENFPEFINKPKIFMFNMCRSSSNNESSAVANTGIMYPDIQNAYLSYSTLPGHFSLRHTGNGSFFVDRFVKTVAEYVRMPSMDLKNLFTAVEFSMNKDRKMIHCVGQQRYLALPCEHKSLVFRRFYFKVQNGNYPSELDGLYNAEMQALE